MIKTHTCYTAACDVCAKEPDGSGMDGVAHFDDTDEALEQAGISEWWATESVVLCGAAGPEHSVKAADIAAALIQNDTDGEALDDFRDWCEMVGYELEAFADDMPVEAEAAANV